MKVLAQIASALALSLIWSGPSLAQVSGDISGVWVSGSTVLVTGDLRVPTGLELVVEPGVTVQFNGPFELRVEGRLTAVGSPSNRIAFTHGPNSNRWGGIRFDGADDASVLEQCVIEYASPRRKVVRGGGVEIQNCSPTIRSSELRFNTASAPLDSGSGGAILVGNASRSLIEGNYIHDNVADSGGGLEVYEEGLLTFSTFPEIKDNLFERNEAGYTGGAISLARGASARIHGNIVRGNVSTGASHGGGGIVLWGNPWRPSLVYNNLIVGNVATRGPAGGLFVRYHDALILHNTIADNRARTGAGVAVFTYQPGTTIVDSCIVWGNEAHSAQASQILELTIAAGAFADVRYCSVQGGWTGENIDLDPEFANAGGGDYHILASSPCRDAASGNLPDFVTHDFEGDPRIVGFGPDIGADEIVGSSR